MGEDVQGGLGGEPQQDRHERAVADPTIADPDRELGDAEARDRGVGDELDVIADEPRVDIDVLEPARPGQLPAPLASDPARDDGGVLREIRERAGMAVDLDVARCRVQAVRDLAEPARVQRRVG